MADVYNQFLGYIDVLSEDELFDFTKYEFIASRYIYPVNMGIKYGNYDKLLTLVKRQLPTLSKKLPDDFLNKKILDFVVDSFKNPEIKSFDKLLNNFSPEVLCERNIVLKLHNCEMEEDVYENSSFSLYKPRIFYERFIQNLDLSLNNKWKEVIESIYSPQNLSHPYLILVLKNVVVYHKDNKITENIVKLHVLDWLYFFSNIINNSTFLQTSILHSLVAYSIFSNEMKPIILSDPGEIQFNFYVRPVQITSRNLVDNAKILNTLDMDNQLARRIRKTLRWLGKSKVTNTLEDSFLYIAIAHECLLSYEENSYISASKTQSLSEGLTFLIEDNKEKRIRIYNDIKNMYSKRSAIVHAGCSDITINMRDRFFNYVNRGIYEIIDLATSNINSVKEVKQLIEEKKFS